MSKTTRSLTLALVLAFAATTATGCGANPTAARKIPAAPLTRAAVLPTTAPEVTPTTAPAAPIATGSVMVMLSSLQAEGVAGVAVQLTGEGLEEAVGRTLTLEELKTSNTLAFENIPVGTLKAVVIAFDAAEEAIGQTNADVEVTANGQAKVAIQLSAPATPGVVNFKFVEPAELEATPAPAASATPAPEVIEDVVATPPATEPPVANSKALEVEIVGMATVRKFLLFKKLEVTVRVTNESTTKTLDGDVKIEFHKIKGIFTKEDAIVETLTAPVQSLAPGKSVEITLTSTVAAENAEATVNTVLSSSSASTF